MVMSYIGVNWCVIIVKDYVENTAQKGSISMMDR